MNPDESQSLSERVGRSLERARAALLAERDADGVWTGELSSSALSTAVAAMAMHQAAAAGHPQAEALRTAARRGFDWICGRQNEDGGFGDTVTSPSNISTSLLCWAALGVVAGDHQALQSTLDRVEECLRRDCGDLSAAGLAAVIQKKYGADRTFAVPILTTCALAGRLGEGREAWRHVPALPFELAACPHRWFAWLRLSTVSYALPALIAIGQVRHHFRPTANPVLRLARNMARKRTLRILQDIQPEGGGYLEAAPLTSFVCMSLVAMGRVHDPVCERGLQFLLRTQREDGSWPIDTNLRTWLTTLAIQALGDDSGRDLAAERAWVLARQAQEEHPYTHAAPGGFAWTDLSGGVPDADDTSGALLALHRLGATESEAGREAGAAGARWLVDLQNRDGGVPTFCRGWGQLPFDQSSADITAHAIRALARWQDALPEPLAGRAAAAQKRMMDYLMQVQRDDGAFVPLWFGNQSEPGKENPIYGTACVLRAMAAVQDDGAWREAGARAVRYLLGRQGLGGGLGANPCLEETALAATAWMEWSAGAGADEELVVAVQRALDFLCQHSDEGRSFPAAPIGLYFAQLWYDERLYPILFTVTALERADAFLTHHPAAQPARQGS